MSKFCAFKPRKDVGNVQCRCRGDISCLTDSKKACVRQCTCSWGPNTMERRERQTNCWVHSAIQQHWGTHICIALGLSLGTYRTRGGHITQQHWGTRTCITLALSFGTYKNRGGQITQQHGGTHVHYISPVTRYIHNQGWSHNTTELRNTCALC